MTDQSSPSIEVHVPLLNERASIERLIDSFERQTFKDFTVVLHDNASDDGSSELLNQLVGKSPRYKHVRYDVRKSVYGQAVRIEGYNKRGRFISIRSANDFLLPGYYGEVFELLSGRPDIALAYSHGFEMPEGTTSAITNSFFRISTLGMSRDAAFRHVVSTYTQSFSLWGTYRRDIYERLCGIRCYGSDHVWIAQVSLLGAIASTEAPLDVMVTRPRSLNDAEKAAGLSGLWASHHPELLAGGQISSRFVSPDIYAPFCSMLYGHLEMLRFAVIDDEDLNHLSNIARQALVQRFGKLMINEINRLKEIFADHIAPSLGAFHFSKIGDGLAGNIPRSRLHSLMLLEPFIQNE